MPLGMGPCKSERFFFFFGCGEDDVFQLASLVSTQWPEKQKFMKIVVSTCEYLEKMGAIWLAARSSSSF